MKKLGLSFFPAYDWAISPTHPEREERLLYTQDQLFEEGIDDLDMIEFINPILLDERDLQRVHFILPNLVTESHLIAAGGAYEVYKKYMHKEVEKGFALVRPPGHHAHKVVFGDRGFCIINVGAVALEKIRSEFGPLKVAIVDTDAHHGDGTEDIYWNDPNTLVISMHQDGRTLYPGSGPISDFGGPSAYGLNVNIPLPPNTGESGFLYVLDNLVMPILEDFKPDIIINSAGQDNHYSDPLTNMNFTAQGYAKLNERLNPNLAILEGGYSIETALPYINLGIVLAMAGLDYSDIIEPDYSKSKTAQTSEITSYIEELVDVIYDNWSNRELLAKSKYDDKDYVVEYKNIFYDTSNLMETQTRHYHLCEMCPGYEVIESKSDFNTEIIGVHIPQTACDLCKEKGIEKYKKSKSDFVFLQNRIDDEYYTK